MSTTHTTPSFLAGLLTTQPGKTLWTLFAISLNALRLPLWMLFYLPTSNRPNPKWTFKQAVRVRVVRAFLYNASVVEMKTSLSLEPGKEGSRFVVMPAATEASFTDVVSSDPNVRPEGIGATWWPSVPTPGEAKALNSSNEHVVLHFHGGAYAIGDGRTEDAGFASRTFTDHSSAKFVCAPQYRLSSNAGGRFPAQLQDAVTSYAYLVKNVGVSPDRIVLSGDSAGANLALALVKYLSEFGTDTGLVVDGKYPAAAWLWSIWVNPAVSIEMGPAAMDDIPNKTTDYVGGGFGLWGARGFIPSPTSGHTIRSPWISFGGNAFATKIPLYVSTGECEVLFSDDVKLYEEFKEIKGNTVELSVEENCVHDVILTGKLMGFEAEAALMTQRANAWLQGLPAPSTEGSKSTGKGKGGKKAAL